MDCLFRISNQHERQLRAMGDDLNETPFWKEIQEQATDNKYIIRNSSKSFDGYLMYSNLKKVFADEKEMKAYIYRVAEQAKV
jgi:hypothetical protein